MTENKTERTGKKITLPSIRETMTILGFGLSMSLLLFLFSSETWFVYFVIIPTITLNEFFSQCGMKWSVSKKYFILKYASLVCFSVFLVLIAYTIGFIA